ncbi:tetratricopeptide repeat protein, partial [Deinococcus sp. A31D244]|uniref:tetratricopeptide repeat protein n=1 Tax=Deinococcus sp. A31D244 TaxID=3397675 RepID=UPI0039E00B4F
SYLNGTPPDRTLDAHLTLFGPDHRRLFLALAAQDTPNLGATRAALNLSAATLASTLDTLTREGLTTSGGRVRASTPAQQLLNAHALDTALTHLHLARHHPHDTAWPHWLAARDLWEDHDHTPCAAAAHWHADQELKRGYPAKAARTLEVAPQTDEVRVLRGWAMIHNQIVSDNLIHFAQCLGSCGEIILANALLIRGESIKSEAIIKKAISKDNFDLGNIKRIRAHLKRREGNIKCAADLYFRSSIISLSAGDDYGYIESVSHFLSANFYLTGEIGEDVIHEASALVQGRPGLEALFYNNLANLHICRHNYGEALLCVDHALDSAKAAESEILIAASLLNKGTILHFRGDLSLAKNYYCLALDKCKHRSEIRLIIPILCNLSEISGRIDDLEKYRAVLIEEGHKDVVNLIDKNLEVFNHAQPNVVIGMRNAD